MQFSRRCRICDKLFVATNPNQTTCSDECKAKWAGQKTTTKKERDLAIKKSKDAKHEAFISDAALAKELGLTYGKYQELKYFGKLNAYIDEQHV